MLGSVARGEFLTFILKTVDHKQAVVEDSENHRRWRSFKQPQGEDQQQREEKQHLPTISRAPRETEKQDDSSFTRDGHKVAPHIFPSQLKVGAESASWDMIPTWCIANEFFLFHQTAEKTLIQNDHLVLLPVLASGAPAWIPH